MEISELKPFLESTDPVLTVYVSVEGTEEAEVLVAHALSGLNESEAGWVDRGSIAGAIDKARTVDAAGLCFMARSGGDSLSVPLFDPPRADLATISPVPMLVPLVESLHRSVDHMVVEYVGDPGTMTVHHFAASGATSSWMVSVQSADPADLAEKILGELTTRIQVLVVSVAEPLQRAIVGRLVPGVPPSVQITAVSPDVDLANETVRIVSDFTATDMVQSIRTFRWLASHGSAAEGLQGVVEALAGQSVTTVYVSNSSNEYRVPVETTQGVVEVPAADALIRSGIRQGAMVRVIPDHLHDGPEQGLGATLAEA